MAALSEKEAEAYLDARPIYPIDWYKKIAARTQDHKFAWDVGTGSGQAAIGVNLLIIIFLFFVLKDLYLLSRLRKKTETFRYYMIELVSMICDRLG